MRGTCRFYEKIRNFQRDQDFKKGLNVQIICPWTRLMGNSGHWISPTGSFVQRAGDNSSPIPAACPQHYHTAFFSLDNTQKKFQVSKLYNDVLYSTFKKQLGTQLLTLLFLMESRFSTPFAHKLLLCSSVHIVWINKSIEKSVLIKAKEWD